MYFFLEYVHQSFQTMIIYIFPSDWLNAEPDLLILSGQSISLKLKSTKTWTEGSFYLYDMVKLISEQLKVFTSTTRLLIPTLHIMRSFVCKHFNPNWPRVEWEQVTDLICEQVTSLRRHDGFCRSCIHCVGKIPGTFLKLQWSCQFTPPPPLNSHTMRLVKIKEGQQFIFFASNAINVYAINKLQSTDEAVFTCANEEDQLFFLFFFFCQVIKSIESFLIFKV